MSFLSVGVQYVGRLDFPGYLVGDDGSVWSLLRQLYGRQPAVIGDVPQQLALSRVMIKKVAYTRVSLCRDGKVYSFMVHTLILETFVGPAPPGLECRHLDGDGTNNRLSNLCWGTHLENMDDMRQHGTHRPTLGSAQPESKLHETDIPVIRSLYASGMTRRAIAGQFMVSQSTIGRVIAGTHWKHVP